MIDNINKFLNEQLPTSENRVTKIYFTEIIEISEDLSDKTCENLK